jgi:hypothetical protein
VDDDLRKLAIYSEQTQAGTFVQIVISDGGVADAAVIEITGILGYTHVFGDTKEDQSKSQPDGPIKILSMDCLRNPMFDEIGRTRM